MDVPIGQDLSGAFAFILLVSVPFALILTWVALRMYRRTILKYMMTHASSSGQQDEEETIGEISVSSPRQQLHFSTVMPEHDVVTTAVGRQLLQQQKHSRLRLTLLYGIAGAVHAAIIVFWLFYLDGIEFLPQRTLATWAILLWPTALAIMSIGVANRRQKLWVPFLFLLLPFVVAPNRIVDLATVWAIFLLPPTIIVLLIANRHLRAAGPIILLLVSLFVSALIIWPYVTLWVLESFQISLLNELGLLIALLTVGISFYLLTRYARRYRRKKMSDQMLYLDAWWLLFTAYMSILLISAWGLTGWRHFLAFLAFKIVLWIGYPLLLRTGAQPKSTPLLLLRVFGFQRRAEQLLDEIGAYWRHVGPINLIAGTDLATAYLEPHEFLDFITGRMSQGFVKDRADLIQSMKHLDQERDPDGRFRVNEFFCHDNTWKMTLQRLVEESQAVLMDLRGFAPENQGCIFELTQLLNLAPLQSVVLIIDETTDEIFLRTAMTELWESSLALDSPNRALREPTVQLVFAADQSPKTISNLLRLLANAVTPESETETTSFAASLPSTTSPARPA